MTEEASVDLADLTARITSGYVRHNAVPHSSVVALITTVHAALKGLISPPLIPELPLRPAIPIKKSITNEYLICLEDGRHFKSLKRHLHSAYGLTPDAYRTRWGLPHDYPMVAPGYASKRSDMAKANKLGIKRSGQTSATNALTMMEQIPGGSGKTALDQRTAPAKRRGRPPAMNAA